MIFLLSVEQPTIAGTSRSTRLEATHLHDFEERDLVLDGAPLSIRRRRAEAEDGEHRVLWPGAAGIDRALGTGHADRGQIAEAAHDGLPDLLVPRRVLVADVVAIAVAVLPDFLERLEHQLGPEHLAGAGDTSGELLSKPSQAPSKRRFARQRN